MATTIPIPSRQLFIDGEWREPVKKNRIPVINPATEQIVDRETGAGLQRMLKSCKRIGRNCKTCNRFKFIKPVFIYVEGLQMMDLITCSIHATYKKFFLYMCSFPKLSSIYTHMLQYPVKSMQVLGKRWTSRISCEADYCKCPYRWMSGTRMKIAGRFKPCAHMGCFDLEVFVQMNQRSRKWQCPICLKNYALENVIIDPYFTCITTKMRNCGEDVTEIEVKPDGSWRVKAEKGQKSLGELGEWHKPNGTLCVPVEVESKPKPEAPKQVKQEGGAEGHNTGLKLGIKKNSNGIWEVSKPEKFVNNGNNVNNEIRMSSSATGSGRDGEDPSINQNGGGHFGHSTTNGADFGSLSPNMTPTVADADIIVLSDSEDETENLMSSEPVYSKNGIEDVRDRAAFSTFPDTEDPALIAGGSSCLGLFNTNDDDFGVPFWSLPSTSQMGPTFQLFGSDENVHHGLGGPTSMDDFTLLTDEIGMHSAPPVHDSSLYQSNLDINDGLVDNPLAFGHDDPSLQLFLPTRPSETAEQAESRNQPAASNGLNGDNDWISLSLGGGGTSEDNCKPATTNGLNSNQPPPCKDGDLDPFADTASLLFEMNGSKHDKTSRERSDDPFSFPRQKRSVRPRLYLSIESDSEEERESF